MNNNSKYRDKAIEQYNNSATELYEYLSKATGLYPDLKRVYAEYCNIYNRIINQNTYFTAIKLVGKFAKTDYLLKEYNAPKELVKTVNDFRVRAKNRVTNLNSELERFYLQDLKAISLFISLIYKVKPPLELTNQFPEDIEYKQSSNVINSYIRVIVNEWDEKYIYCNAESEGCENLKMYYGEECGIYKYDWSYISDLLFKGAQLNIIKPRFVNGIIIPELIIFEPDYLVDISAIASCVEEYDESAIVYLINKIKPNSNTSAILLGSLVSQFLDEEIHSKEEIIYSESIKSFFKNNAIPLLSTEIEIDFHTKAKQQKNNMHNAIGIELPKRVSTFKFEDALIEPSFFSEMLGIQGRMDMLMTDFSLLIEQKSGRCGFPQTDPDTPTVNKKHYVQMLLYMALLRYNYPEQYKANKEKLRAFLLYSKYKNSLLGLGFAPELLFSSIKIRNEIVKNEYSYSEDGVEILKSLTPEILNSKKTNGTLWNKYIYPQLNELLSPIKNASELEQAYYFRFLKFIEKEHIYSKIGNRIKENSGFASKWGDTLEEKLNSGNIYNQLSLVYPSKNHNGIVDEVELKFKSNINHDIANFRVGDIVILFPYNSDEEPDLRKTIVFRCSIVSIELDKIRLSLRAPQTNSKIFLKDADKEWAIEHDFMESSYSSLYKAMHKFLSSSKSRRDLLMLQRKPKVNKTIQLNGEYNQFNELALKAKQAEELFLIVGPPGTGKTSFGLLTTLKEELTQTSSNILLLSYTNRAVDEICSKLVEENIDFIRFGNKNSCDKKYVDYLLENRSQKCSNIKELDTLIKDTRIFAGTTSSLNGNISLFNIKQFDLAIIDEASQILEPNIIGALSEERNGVPAIKKFVMIGDHKQLPAVVQQQTYESQVEEKVLNNIHLTDCSLSLFERLLKRYKDDPAITYMLTKQGRMHSQIAHFPNISFYNGTLACVPLKHQTEELENCKNPTNISEIISSQRVIFFASDRDVNNTNNKVNITEAQIIADLVYNIYKLNIDSFEYDKTIGVIVPYRNQIATIRNIIENNYPGSGLNKICIDTVERFQGSQRDYIIYGFTIKEYQQLKFLSENTFIEDGKLIDRKLNVVMTRAKKHLICVGNEEIISKNTLFKQLIEYTKNINSFYVYNKISK